MEHKEDNDLNMNITQTAARLNSNMPSQSTSITSNIESNIAIKSTAPNAMITPTLVQSFASSPNLQWTLLEMVQVTEDCMDSDHAAPMQWFKFNGSNPDAQGPIILLSGFNGATKNDSRMLQLLQKALSSGVISASSDIYLCPIVNPTSKSKKSHVNRLGVDILNSFPTAATMKNGVTNAPEIQSILYWIEKVQPKAVITLHSEKAFLNQFGVADELIEKLSALAERPLLKIGESPEVEIIEEVSYNALGLPIKMAPAFRAYEEPRVIRNDDGHIGRWCEEKEIIWLSVSVDAEQKSFDDIKEDWRLNIGPAMKWLLEAPRFNPPEQEPEVETPTVVGVLDLPPELMFL